MYAVYAFIANSAVIGGCNKKCPSKFIRTTLPEIRNMVLTIILSLFEQNADRFVVGQTFILTHSQIKSSLFE